MPDSPEAAEQIREAAAVQIVVPQTDPPSIRAGAQAEQAEAEDLEHQKQRLIIQNAAQDIRLRRKYANRIFYLVRYWLIGVLGVLILQGALGPWKLFDLSENVLLALIGGTTVNVLGLFVVVINYLFPKRPVD